MIEWIINNYIELFGAVAGIIYVFLEIRQNIWLWPVGIITSAVYLWVFFDTGFYADMGLQWYYLIISFYGWYWWRRGNSSTADNVLPVTRVNIKGAIVIASAIFIIFLIIWFILIRFTNSTIPGWDAFTTATSIVATWMLARKILEHWVLWIIADVVSMGLYIYKGLFPTLILFGVYTVMAVIGYREWVKGVRSKE
ncbi:MAG: nicotinamide riboside transporter PnuC [Bacteroidales bacterium]|nr:nicotinamide riboside transporter PnuC [Bacteroidales bacterium]